MKRMFMVIKNKHLMILFLSFSFLCIYFIAFPPPLSALKIVWIPCPFVCRNIFPKIGFAYTHFCHVAFPPPPFTHHFFLFRRPPGERKVMSDAFPPPFSPFPPCLLLPLPPPLFRSQFIICQLSPAPQLRKTSNIYLPLLPPPVFCCSKNWIAAKFVTFCVGWTK